MKKLGIIGGLGPMATAYFFELITQRSAAKTDQEHIEVILHSKPQIPDRTEYILGKSSKSPVPDMMNVGLSLAKQGATTLAIPCITAHYFQKELEEGIGIPIINALEETAQYLLEREIQKVGIMATNGTIESGIFQKVLEESGIEVVIPDKEKQQKVMSLIYENVKAGVAVDISKFGEVSKALFEQNAQVVLLACTELSLIKREYELGSGFLDVMELLAQKSVLACGKLLEEYNELIT